MKPNPSYFQLRSNSTSITLNERFSRLNQKKPSNATPPIRRGGIQKPRSTINMRNMRGRLTQMSQVQQNNAPSTGSGPVTSPGSGGGHVVRGSTFNRRGLSRPGLSRTNFMARSGNLSSFTNNTTVFGSRGVFRGRGAPGGRGVGLGIAAGGRGRGVGLSRKTPEQTKQELDAELDEYMKG